MAEKRDYYEVLGVSKTATDAEIKKATCSAACAIKCCMTKLIILASLIRIRQYGIGPVSYTHLISALYIFAALVSPLP